MATNKEVRKFLNAVSRKKYKLTYRRINNKQKTTVRRLAVKMI